MATDNKGIMVYLAPDLVEAIAHYCIENGITRRIGSDEAAPSLGTGIAHYLKSTILNTVPLPDKNIALVKESNNNPGLSEEKITDLIQQYNNNPGLSEEKITDLIQQYNNNHGLSDEKITDLIEEYNNNHGLSEEKITDLIEEKISTFPPTFSLQDIDRLIGSAISSVTTKNDVVVADLKARIDKLSKIVEDLARVDNQPIEAPHSSNPPESLATNLSWSGFCELIEEPLPPQNKRNKASGDRMVKQAESKDFNGWRYDGNKRNFTQPPN